jgi:HEAT repeat protein
MTAVTGAAPGDRDRERIAEIEALDAGSVDVLIGALDEPSWVVRRAVVAALGRLGDAAIPALVRALVTDRTDERRISATVDALVASAGDPLPFLVALDGAPPSILCDAAQILGRRRSADAVDALLAWAGHTDDNVAVAAMEALGRIGTGAELDVLAAAARSGAFFRVFAAIEILARYEDPRALAPLRYLLDVVVAVT